MCAEGWSLEERKEGKEYRGGRANLRKERRLYMSLKVWQRHIPYDTYTAFFPFFIFSRNQSSVLILLFLSFLRGSITQCGCCTIYA